MLADNLQTFVTTINTDHAVAFPFQVVADDLHDVRLIFDDDYLVTIHKNNSQGNGPFTATERRIKCAIQSPAA